MNQPKLLFAVLCFTLHIFALELTETLSAQNMVPLPAKVKADSDDSQKPFRFGEKLNVVSPAGNELWSKHLNVFGTALNRLTKTQLIQVDASKSESAQLVVLADPSLSSEGYRLSIQSSQIKIHAKTLKGLTHATASLLQLSGIPDGINPFEIDDQPSCQYRSFMIDMGRNAHSALCLKETIDLCWFYKVDSIHLHLTDDQRIAFPSKTFPKLTTQRGLITWDEFAELEEYAHVRGVALIPELEVPGHSQILTRQYPEAFGKNGTELASSETALKSIKILLDEMMELFPSSPYVHVGGDEAFGVPEELQRELINKLHAYLKTKGKKTLVWEGPRLGKGENKVNPEVIHINWRTINFPANQMLEAGYPVVNAAWDPLYIVDHYPRNNFTMASPQHIYENTDLLKFKHFNPGIPTFARPIQVKPNEQLIGFCMPWWEGREKNYFPMIVPRLIPMAEVAWNHDAARDYEKFSKRVEETESIRNRIFYPCSISGSSIVIESDGVFHGSSEISLKSTLQGELRYTLDGTAPTSKSTLFSTPFKLEKSAIIRCATFVNGKQVGHGSRRTMTQVNPVDNLALGKPVTSSTTSGAPFSVERLTDGGTGNLDYYLGYPGEPEPIKITVDLGKPIEINQIVMNTFSNGGTFEKYELQISKDGKTFEPVAKRHTRPEKSTGRIEHDFELQSARYVRVLTHGCKGYVFDSFSRITEIQVFKK